MTDDVIDGIIETLSQPYIAGLSILGGEPFEPENQGEVLRMIRAAKERNPGKTVWIYSGFTLEQLQGDRRTDAVDEILSLADVLIDGPYIEEQRNIMLRFRGSENQRIIDLKTL